MKQGKRISDTKEKEIIKLYKNGSGTCEIAKKLDLNRWTILKYLKLNNLKPQRLTRPYKNKHNIHFFSKYTKESAYWAGFIMADGNIHSKKNVLQIGLAKKDEKHLVKFNNNIQFTGPIYIDISTDSRKSYISGKWLIEDLKKNYGITSNKTFNCVFPDIPKKYIWHFIRGIFDGDGSVYGKYSPCISFIGNKSIIKSIRDLLHNSLELEIQSSNDKAPLYKTKNTKIKQFAYSGENARKIIKWLYKDSNENIRLDRKYDKCMEWLENSKDRRFGPNSQEHKDKISKANSGENGPLAKLKNIDAIKIRELYSSGANSKSELAKIYNVGYDCIRHIIIRKTFKNV